MTPKTLSPDLEYYVGRLEPPYESQGEAMIGRMLDEYGIPFFYKQATLIFDNGRRTIWRPDFTLPTYNNAVIQYHQSDGRASRIHNDLARQNDIAALFLKSSGLAGPDWQ